MVKTCNICHQTKDVGEFHRNAQGRFGVSSRCKECANAATAAWRAANVVPKRPKLTDDERRKRRVESSRRYASSVKGRAKLTEWRGSHPELVRSYAQQHYAAQVDIYKTRASTWAAQNAALRQEIQRDWKRRHPDAVRDDTQKRRAMRREAFVEPVSRRAIYERDNGICGICREPVPYRRFHLDHIIPIAFGGTHEPSNVQVSHGVCNMRKGARVQAPAI